MEAFIEARVGQHFHMSFQEFLSQPSYVCDLMLEVLNNRAPAQAQELQDLVNEFKGNK
jgi:hypothetical protein